MNGFTISNVYIPLISFAPIVIKNCMKVRCYIVSTVIDVYINASIQTPNELMMALKRLTSIANILKKTFYTYYCSTNRMAIWKRTNNHRAMAHNRLKTSVFEAFLLLSFNVRRLYIAV